MHVHTTPCFSICAKREREGNGIINTISFTGAVMMLELVLVQPPNMYEVTPPATYAEAGQMLYSAGEIILNVVEAQPTQETFEQTLTAQTLKELGRGWTSVFSIMPSDPSSPEPGNARFQWVPGETLHIAFPEDAIGQQACDGIEGLYRAVTWREVMQFQGRRQLPELLGEFELRYLGTLESGATERMADAVGDLVTELYGMLFQFKGTNDTLLKKLEVNWGGAGDCLPALAKEYRNSRR